MIQHFAEMVEPIREMIRQKHFKWRNEASEAWENIVTEMENREVDFFGGDVHYLYTNASNKATGALLYNHKGRFVAVHSRTLS